MAGQCLAGVTVPGKVEFVRRCVDLEARRSALYMDCIVRLVDFGMTGCRFDLVMWSVVNFTSPETQCYLISIDQALAICSVSCGTYQCTNLTPMIPSSGEVTSADIVAVNH